MFTNIHQLITKPLMACPMSTFFLGGGGGVRVGKSREECIHVCLFLLLLLLLFFFLFKVPMK